MPYRSSALSLSQENTNGLLVWWSFAAGSALDVSGSGNPGVLTLSPTVVDGVVRSRGVPGTALQFNGTSNYVISTKLINIPLVTVSAWVKVNGNPASTGQISGFVEGLGSSTCDKILEVTTGGVVRWYVFDGAGKLVTGTVVITDNQWHHVAGVADGTTSSLYIDGKLDNSTAAGSTFTGYTVPNCFVNATNTAVTPAATYLACQCDDFRVYKRGLAASEINAIYNSVLASNTDEWEMPALPLVASSSKFYTFGVSQDDGRSFTQMMGY